MVFHGSRRSGVTLFAAATAALALAVGACGGGGDDGGSGAGGAVTLSFLVDNGENTVKAAEALATAFHTKNPNITVKVETRPQGGDGDNVVKTRLSTQEMTDVFMYNAGSLLQALNPAGTLQPLNDQPWVSKLDKAFVPAVSSEKQVFGAPWGSGFGGGILYNKKVYEKLGLEVPKTWDEFMANNAKIKAAGIVPVIQSYGETWSSQLLVLADYHNIAAQDPSWADKYTKNQVKYSSEPAVEGFRHLEEIKKAGDLNENFASVKVPAALKMLAEGKGAHYPLLTASVPNLLTSNPKEINDVGFFAQPGTDAAKNGLTLWLPPAVYIPKSTEGEKLDAAKKFVAFIATPEGCDVFNKAVPPTGPFLLQGCELPADVPTSIKDLQPYVDEGHATPALEFLSPIKGPALEQITVEVGSGLRPAQSGAELYDKDVQKQAQQLGLPGW
jgi:raffinose/stachyose/melibiose transport system substrate-binding protein